MLEASFVPQTPKRPHFSFFSYSASRCSKSEQYSMPRCGSTGQSTAEFRWQIPASAVRSEPMIDTARLTIEQVTIQEADAALQGADALAALMRVDIAAGVPWSETLEVFPVYR